MQIKILKSWLAGRRLCDGGRKCLRIDCRRLCPRKPASTGTLLVPEGDRASDITPVSKFKIVPNLMGIDAGILLYPATPSWPCRLCHAGWGAR